MAFMSLDKIIKYIEGSFTRKEYENTLNKSNMIYILKCILLARNNFR